MQYGCVVSTPERVANFWQTHSGEFFGQRHCDLPRSGNLPVTPLGMQVRDTHLEIFRDDFLDILYGDLAFLKDQQVAQCFPSKVGIDLASGKVSTGDYPVERALEFPHIGPNLFGYKKTHIFGQVDAFLLGFDF